MYLDKGMLPGDAIGSNEDFKNVEDEVEPESMLHDRRGISRFRYSLIDQMYERYSKNPWYRH